MLFADRAEAGRLLAEALAERQGAPDTLILALPRGGVPVASEVARALQLPLDVLIVRKLGVPGHEELAFGAIASGGAQVFNDELISEAGLGEREISEVSAREERELIRRERIYRGSRPPLAVTGERILLIDDGVATGATMMVAIAALAEKLPERIAVAIPVAPHSTCAQIRRKGIEVTCLQTPEPFGGVGLWYQNFSQTSDDEVRRVLRTYSR